MEEDFAALNFSPGDLAIAVLELSRKGFRIAFVGP
jgi:hypothetical protein